MEATQVGRVLVENKGYKAIYDIYSVKLEVPVIRQKRGTNECGLAGVAMILRYYGIKASLNELKREIQVDETGTYAPQLGRYLMHKGLQVEIVSMHPSLFTLKDSQRSSAHLLKRFREIRRRSKSKQNRIVLGHFIAFLKQGGTIKVKIPDEKEVRQEIAQGRPIGALLTSHFLTSTKPGFNFHFNILTGIDATHIYVNDPLPGSKGGRQKYKIKDFLYGIYASTYGDVDNGCLIKVTKPKI